MGMGQEVSPEQIKQFMMQELQKIPQEKLVEIAKNPAQFMKMFMEAIMPLVGNPEIAAKLVESVFAEIFTMAQVQTNQTMGMLNPELMEAPPQAGGQPPQPQPQQPQRLSVLGGQ
jgi:hypothetical protein